MGGEQNLAGAASGDIGWTESESLGAPMKRATYEDVANAPDHVVAELLDGELVLNPRPAARHAAAMAAIHGTLWSRFDGGERRPSGWIVLPEPELHFGATVVVPDVAAWRRERLPVVPDQPWLELALDWVCEVLSPSTVRIDRGRKLAEGTAAEVRANPEVVRAEGWEVGEEGCLSVPGVYDEVKRASSIDVTALDEGGRPGAGE